jgi:hypothetical protein
MPRPTPIFTNHARDALNCANTAMATDVKLRHPNWNASGEPNTSRTSDVTNDVLKDMAKYAGNRHVHSYNLNSFCRFYPSLIELHQAFESQPVGARGFVMGKLAGARSGHCFNVKKYHDATYFFDGGNGLAFTPFDFCVESPANPDDKGLRPTSTGGVWIGWPSNLFGNYMQYIDLILILTTDSPSLTQSTVPAMTNNRVKLN